MKILYIANGRAFSDEEIAYLNSKKIGGIERVAHNSFLFDASEASGLLADLQNYCKTMSIPYQLFYLTEEPIRYSSL
ncbi:hypothetical protein [Acinetobacter junii]|uniref:hypothetical protein n=1 Tax=Acinetobacter junii TaxID=40215 RepID=UPI0022EA9A28|nr:hypothetical protein [Acinetobacter junii]MDA3509283.1 hypothetical protein [Acinetobacter junii]MDA3533582.1 hypothetical protein [Acinetobacter junii]MDR7655524.1 hypothetical protein [Acinetobacter junii]